METHELMLVLMGGVAFLFMATGEVGLALVTGVIAVFGTTQARNEEGKKAEDAGEADLEVTRPY